MSSLASQLDAQGRQRVWAAYWIAADLTVCGYPKVTAAAVSVSRDAVARREVAATSPSVYVGFAGNSLDQQIGSYVASHPGLADRRLVDGFAVWYFHGRVEPGQMNLDSVF